MGDRHISVAALFAILGGAENVLTLFPVISFIDSQLVIISQVFRAAAPTFHLHGIVILIMAVLSVVAIRFGYKALLIEWAIDAISKAEKEFVGTKLGEARLAVVVSWLREKVPAPIRFLVTDDLIRKAVQTSFNAAKSGLEVLKNA